MINFRERRIVKKISKSTIDFEKMLNVEKGINCYAFARSLSYLDENREFYTPGMLYYMVKEGQQAAEEKLEELKREEADKKATSESIIPAYNQFKTWAETFDQTTFEQKKLIASALFSRVDIGKNYQIHLELDTTYQAFCDEWLAPTLKTATA